MKTTYKITRQYFEDEIPNEVLDKGLTKAEAREHCKNTETCSSTCSEATKQDELKRSGSKQWRDGYDTEWKR